jgi:hypothetical protein
MNVLKALATVVATAVVFGMAGTGIGMFLGKMAPSFLRHAVGSSAEEGLDPMELGIGLGLTNGLTWGLVVGILAVAILAWRESRLSRSR